MIGIVKRVTKKAFNLAGLDIRKLSNNPEFNLLGLKNLSIKTIIDVGANEGQFARNILRFFPDTYLFCFEPLPAPFKKLDKWASNRKNKVKVFNVALSNSEGDAKIFCHLEHSSSSSFLKSTEACKDLYPFTKKQTFVSVKLTTLDKALANLSEPISPEILIKLDVQGYEDRVIRGGSEVFRKAKACILEVCLDRLYEGQASFKDILFLLDELGYRYVGNLDQSYADDGHVIFIDAVFIKTP